MLRISYDSRKISRYFNRVGGLIPSLGIDVDTSDPCFRCTMKVERTTLSVPHFAHGGAIMALMDTTMGMLALKTSFLHNMAASTVECKVNFLSPARAGEEIVATSKFESKGQTLMVIIGEAFEKQTKRKVALAVGTFNMYPVDPKSELQQYLAKSQ